MAMQLNIARPAAFGTSQVARIRQCSQVVHTRQVVSQAAKRETVIPDPSYHLPAALAGISGLGVVSGNATLAGISGILAAFLAIQASRVKFVFGPESLEVVIGDEMKESENKFVGGENVWRYDEFTNWEFWWPGFPVLVYYKETQTKPEGQIHFFPVIFNGKQVYDVMVERCGKSETSGPKE